MRIRPFAILLPIAVFTAGISGCTSEGWVTPLAPYRPSRGADCHVTLTRGQAPEGTENLAIARCAESTFDNGGCEQIVREKTCKIGGDVVYGVHWEQRFHQEATMVGTIGVTKDGVRSARNQDVP